MEVMALVDIQANIDRFSGFADLYDESRPKPPQIVTDILMLYLGKIPELVVDIGSGTGLSSFIWSNKSKRVIGIEPNDDMRNQAGMNASKRCLTNISFIKAAAHETGLDKDNVDIVTCSQAFHWMEPKSTLMEIARILKNEGIFAAFDCDWPPVAGYAAEEAYNTLANAARENLKAIPEENKAFQYPKESHLKNIQESGYFGYFREIVFHNRETCSKERFIGMALSQGAVQTLLKNNPADIENDIKEFRQAVMTCWNQTEVTVCYRMRIGIKKC